MANVILVMGVVDMPVEIACAVLTKFSFMLSCVFSLLINHFRDFESYSLPLL